MEDNHGMDGPTQRSPTGMSVARQLPTSFSLGNSVGINSHVQLAGVVVFGLGLSRGSSQGDESCRETHCDRMCERLVWLGVSKLLRGVVCKREKKN